MMEDSWEIKSTNLKGQIQTFRALFITLSTCFLAYVYKVTMPCTVDYNFTEEGPG